MKTGEYVRDGIFEYTLADGKVAGVIKGVSTDDALGTWDGYVDETTLGTIDGNTDGREVGLVGIVVGGTEGLLGMEDGVIVGILEGNFVVGRPDGFDDGWRVNDGVLVG